MTQNYKKLPRVALAGRRNVGKSTLLNALYGRGRAITDAHAGLTRDILEVEIRRKDYHFLLSDTPGLDIDNPNRLEKTILDRAFEYIKNVDLLLFVFEAPAPAPFDYEFCELLRKRVLDTNVLYVVNKIDGKEQADEGLAEFYALGLSPLIPVSAKARWNFSGLLEEMAQVLPKIRLPKTSQSVPQETSPQTSALETQKQKSADDPDWEDRARQAQKRERRIEEAWATRTWRPQENTEKADATLLYQESLYASRKDRRIHEDTSVLSDSRHSETRIALVGRPNAGKSSLFNKIIQRDLAVVSDIPGTTRDTMDTVIRFQGRHIRLVDTAGLRRPGKYKGKDSVEFYSAARTRRAIRDARIVIHLIDTLAGLSDYDKKIAAQIRNLSRPTILAFNKWDAVEDKHEHSMREYLDRFSFLFPQIQNIPHVFCSARNGKRISRLLELALELDEAMKIRIPTSELNKRVSLWLKKGPTSSRKLRVYYVTQIETEPPAIAFFINQKRFFRENLRLYIENKIRKEYGLWGIPIDILIREKNPKGDPKYS